MLSSAHNKLATWSRWLPVVSLPATDHTTTTQACD